MSRYSEGLLEKDAKQPDFDRKHTEHTKTVTGAQLAADAAAGRIKLIDAYGYTDALKHWTFVTNQSISLDYQNDDGDGAAEVAKNASGVKARLTLLSKRFYGMLMEDVDVGCALPKNVQRYVVFHDMGHLFGIYTRIGDKSPAVRQALRILERGWDTSGWNLNEVLQYAMGHMLWTAMYDHHHLRYEYYERVAFELASTGARLEQHAVLSKAFDASEWSGYRKLLEETLGEPVVYIWSAYSRVVCGYCHRVMDSYPFFEDAKGEVIWARWTKENPGGAPDGFVPIGGYCRIRCVPSKQRQKFYVQSASTEEQIRGIEAEHCNNNDIKPPGGAEI